MNEGEGGTNNPRGVRVSAAAFDGCWSFFVHHRKTTKRAGSMQRRRCGMRDQRRRRRGTTPPSPCTSERSRRRAGCATKRRHHLATFLLSSPLSVPSCSRFRCTSSSCSAERYAPRTEPLWKLARSPARGIDVRARRTSCSDQTRVDRVSDD